MSATDIEKVITPDLRTPRMLGQATAIEQSRAIAEVQAMVVVAQGRPRNIQTAIAEMRQSCGLPAMADRAFYRYTRGGSTVSGATVHLMRELARCFGNVTYGIAELRRDDEAGISEMQAFAWDLQTNTRSAQIFIVPHKRDKRGGAEPLVELRDVYEMTANQGARRLREAIKSILLPWFVEDAIEACNTTLRDGGGVPLPKRIAECIKGFEVLGVSAERIEQKLDRHRDKWTDHDMAQLSVIYKSLQRGEITVDEEFPPERVTVAEITGGKAKGKARPATVPEADPDEPQPPEGYQDPFTEPTP